MSYCPQDNDTELYFGLLLVGNTWRNVKRSYSSRYVGTAAAVNLIN